MVSLFFISGPLPTYGLGYKVFSRLLDLNTWLQHTCNILKFGFSDNFNLFWNRRSFYKAGGVHPNQLGSRILAAGFTAPGSHFHTGPIHSSHTGLTSVVITHPLPGHFFTTHCSSSPSWITHHRPPWTSPAITTVSLTYTTLQIHCHNQHSS